MSVCEWLPEYVCVCVCECVCVWQLTYLATLWHTLHCVEVGPGWGTEQEAERGGRRTVAGGVYLSRALCQLIGHYKITDSQWATVKERERARGGGRVQTRRAAGGDGERYRTCSSDDMPNTKAISHCLTNTQASTHTRTFTHTHKGSLTHTHTHIEAHACKKNYHLSKSQHETVLN